MECSVEVDGSPEMPRWGTRIAMAGSCLGTRKDLFRAALVPFLSSRGAICEAVRLKDMTGDPVVAGLVMSDRGKMAGCLAVHGDRRISMCDV